MDKKKSIVYLGFAEFPYGLAEVQKIILISKSLLLCGNEVRVICRNGTHSKKLRPELQVNGNFENIKYTYASGSCFRNPGFLSRRFLEIKGKINEVRLIKKYKKEKKLDFAILSTRSFNSILLYYILSKLYGFKIILNYVEYYSGMKKGKLQLSKHLNDKCFDRYAPVLSHGVFPISQFLIDKIEKVAPGRKYLKISNLTDFEKYSGIETTTCEKYYLFCGYAGYKEIILFIIDSFALVDNSCSLYLVVNGSDNDISDIKDYINSQEKKEQIKVQSNLSQKDLFTFYQNAIALLIPLRPTLQDIARFPHKIGEYMASGNPVITTNIGEVKYHFKDMENMLIANEYDVQLFADKMKFITDHPSKAQEIGLRGKNAALANFDYRQMATSINNFLNEI